MFGPLKSVFDYVVETRNLVVIDSGGSKHRFGDESGPAIIVRLADRWLEYGLVCNPQLVLGEAYMQGRFIVEKGTIYDFLDVILNNAELRPFPRWMCAIETLRHLSKRVQQFNSVARSRTNVAHHYDIDRAIYELFLDPDKQYSCAYFQGEGGLDEAQHSKKRHLAAKLALSRRQRVLDIGSGWGGLALYLAKVADVDVTGITLSDEQLKFSRDRAAKAGLAQSVRFEMLDYRSPRGPFDRIISVGMFEHVGVGHFKAYFTKIRELLADDGVALVHSIGRFDGPTVTNPFIAKYIFPGGYIPALSEVLPAIERSGLIVTDIEILRLHYAETLRHWRERFRANWHKAEALLGVEFCRMWEYYLAASETAFRYQNLMVFQIQLAKRQGALPLTRDYIMQEEHRLAALEQSPPRSLPEAAE
jgi:cyclopropane-fatty-acyl-phospholipid synthase